MKNLRAPILLAAAIVAIAVLAMVDLVPEELAQMAPFLLLAMFPEAWLKTGGRRCSAGRRAT